MKNSTLLLWLAMLGGLAAPALACKCKPSTVAANRQRADAVVLAEVDRVRPDPDGARERYRLRVHGTWKGTNYSCRWVESSTHRCGAFLRPGQRQVLFLHRREREGGEETFYTSACSGNRALEHIDLDELGPMPPAPSVPNPSCEQPDGQDPSGWLRR